MKSRFLFLFALLTAAMPACADQLQTGHTFSAETVTATKLNDAVNKASALPGFVGDQAAFAGEVKSSDELLLRRVDSNALVKITVAQILPVGTMLDFAGPNAPAGWLLCDGSAVSRTTYAALYTALGGASSPYGQGDGSTTFNLPDARGRVTAGRDTSVAGNYALRLTNANTGNPGIDSKVLGAVGGVDRWTLSIAQMPGHNHQTWDFGLATNTETGGNATRVTGFTGTNTTIGGGEAHPIVQPTIIVNKIIRF